MNKDQVDLAEKDFDFSLSDAVASSREQTPKSRGRVRGRKPAASVRTPTKKESDDYDD